MGSNLHVYFNISKLSCFEYFKECIVMSTYFRQNKKSKTSFDSFNSNSYVFTMSHKAIKLSIN